MTQNTYEAHAFHDDLPKGRSSGTLEIDSSSIRFEGGGKTVVMQISELSLSLGGASDRLVYFNDPAHPDWTVYTSDRSVLKDSHLKEHPELFSQMKKARTKHASNWALLVSIALIFLATPVVLYLSMDVLSRIAANQVPPEWEASLGKATFAQYSINHKLMDDELADELLSPMTDSLLATVDTEEYDYKIFIVNDESINAFALPGGYIVIHSGLIIRADNAEEMLGVLGHEIAHVTEKHGIRNIISTIGTYAIVDLFFGDTTGMLALLTESAPLLLSQSYSRDFEREADQKGFEFLQLANIDPVGLRDFFFKIKEEYEKMLDKMSDENSRDIMEATFSVLSTHPATDERIDNINELLQNETSQREYKEFDEEFAKLKEEVKLFVTETGGTLDEESGDSDEEDEEQEEGQEAEQ